MINEVASRGAPSRSTSAGWSTWILTLRAACEVRRASFPRRELARDPLGLSNPDGLSNPAAGVMPVSEVSMYREASCSALAAAAAAAAAAACRGVMSDARRMVARRWKRTASVQRGEEGEGETYVRTRIDRRRWYVPGACEQHEHRNVTRSAMSAHQVACVSARAGCRVLPALVRVRCALPP